MATTVRVPLNTMLADLDETLRAMLKRELGTHGFDGVEIAFDGQYKASVDYVVTVSCEAGTSLDRGPEVRTQTIRLRDRAGGRAILEEFHRIGGVVRGADEEPVAKAWVVVDDIGWTVTDKEGKFRFD